MDLSNRARVAPPSPIRKLVPLADRAKAAGARVYHLNIGQPDIPTPPAMWEALRRANIEVLDYSPSGGIPAFVQALQGYYRGHGHDLAREELIVTTAGSEAILFALAVVCDPGDEIVIPEPFYANYNGYATLLGVRVAPVASLPETGYALPPRSELEARIGPRTRAILLCNPCNPTGRVYTREEFTTVVELARRHDLYFIADEVYREFCYADEAPISVLGFPEIADRAIMVDSLSKRFSVCGARVGCLAARNRELVAAAMKFAQARLSPPTLGQLMGIAGLALPPSYHEQVREEYRRRRDAVLEELGRMPGVVCRPPQGAFYVMAKLPVDDAEAFVRWLLDEFRLEGETLMVAPGNGFYATPGAGASEVRIAYVLEVEKLRRAMRILAAALRAYRPAPAAAPGTR
ncbi:MAG: pyridoxal phosphate-dependent aminotransferase [Candidatus Eisenbacteria bacterium]|uniref:Aminotransferase n=1 Tax=Eiseniibacteriota bacterium TaxID=2212470 RepID=A0A937X5X3_UNCEI|nr:pyridoxal phosphate-dependent aminotransferase [Candidatus Eisenbacteria bacterium]